MKTSWTKLRSLTPRARGTLILAVLLLPLVHVALVLVGYARLGRAAERLLPVTELKSKRSESDARARAEEIYSLVGIAARHGLVKATCLRRALVVGWLLRGEGIPSTISFGVRTVNGRLEAHAWVEHDGIAVGDAADAHGQFQALGAAMPPTMSGL